MRILRSYPFCESRQHLARLDRLLGHGPRTGEYDNAVVLPRDLSVCTLAAREAICQAHIERRDYISAMVVIESLFDEYGAFVVDGVFEDEVYRKLYYRLSLAYVNIGPESRALRFKCDTFLSPLDWVVEFGRVFGFASEYCLGIVDDPRLDDPSNWKLRAQLEFLSTLGRFDEAIELCEDAIENIDDEKVCTRLLYYLACIYRSSGDAIQASKIYCATLQSFPIRSSYPFCGNSGTTAVGLYRITDPAQLAVSKHLRTSFASTSMLEGFRVIHIHFIRLTYFETFDPCESKVKSTYAMLRSRLV